MKPDKFLHSQLTTFTQTVKSYRSAITKHFRQQVNKLEFGLIVELPLHVDFDKCTNPNSGKATEGSNHSTFR